MMAILGYSKMELKQLGYLEDLIAMHRVVWFIFTQKVKMQLESKEPSSEDVLIQINSMRCISM